jgi:hypothetical protein
MFQRRQWRSDCPAVFHRSAAIRRAAVLGLKFDELAHGRKMSFPAWRRKYIRRSAGQVAMPTAMAANFGTPIWDVGAAS